MLNENQLNHYWRYCDLLNNDLGIASRFVEPVESNYNVFSLEFARIILSACAEVEAVGKLLYTAIKSQNGEKEKKDVGMGDIVKILLSSFPLIDEAYMTILHTGIHISPFYILKKDTKKEHTWWSDYTDIKHNRHDTENFKKANLINAINSVAALAIINNYLHFRVTGDYALPFGNQGLLDSPYAYQHFCVRSGVDLPNCVWEQKKPID